MILQGTVGPQPSANGTNPNIRQGKFGEIITADGFGRYHEPASRNQIFSAANQAAVNTPAGLTASSLNFTLFNPAGSGVLVSLLDIMIAIAAAPAAASVIWLVQNNNPLQAAPATTTSLVASNNNLNTSSGAAKAFSTATLAAVPSILRLLGAVPAASNNTINYIKDEVAGLVIIQPGTYVSIQALSAISIYAAMTWQEIPIV